MLCEENGMTTTITGVSLIAAAGDAVTMMRSASDAVAAVDVEEEE